MEEKKRQPCVVYSRVTGYIVPTMQWNPGKTSEFESRTPFTTYNKEDLTKLK